MKHLLTFILLLIVCCGESRGEPEPLPGTQRIFSPRWIAAARSALPPEFSTQVLTFQETTNLLCRESLRGNIKAEELWGLVLFVQSDTQREADSALQLMHDSADKGNVPAMLQLGHLSRGVGFVSRNDKDSFHWFNLAADKGDPEAQLESGVCYYLGRGTTQDFSMAVNYYRLAAGGTNYLAMKNLGFLLMNGIGATRDVDGAKYWFTRAANEGGNRRAMYDLGVISGMGFPDTNSMAESFRWYWKSANLGDPLACFAVAQTYYNGWGVVKTNATLYHYWCFKAASLGVTDAQYFTGVAYLTGNGVSRDDDVAVAWLRKAAAKNHPKALYALAVYYWQKRPDRTSVILANDFMLRAAQAGHREAQFQYAMMEFRGEVYTPEFEMGKKWLAMSAENGWGKAEMTLFRLLYDGISPGAGCPAYPQNRTEAMIWLRRAAKHGSLDAQERLAVMMIQGTGMDKDKVQAEKLLRYAAEHGNAVAQNDLGYAIKNGDMSSKDSIEAAKWCRLAMLNDPDIHNLAGINYTNTLLRLDPGERLEAEKRAKDFRALPVAENAPLPDGWEKNASYHQEDN